LLPSRWLVLLVWVAIAVGFTVLNSAYGGSFRDQYELPDTESQEAFDLLAEHGMDVLAGFTGRVVFHADDVTDPTDDATAATLVVIPESAPRDEATTDLVHTLRDDVIHAREDRVVAPDVARPDPAPGARPDGPGLPAAAAEPRGRSRHLTLSSVCSCRVPLGSQEIPAGLHRSAEAEPIQGPMVAEHAAGTLRCIRPIRPEPSTGPMSSGPERGPTIGHGNVVHIYERCSHKESKSMNDAIVARELVKTYGDVLALDNLSLSVPEGTVLGVLGPNGAGKTTAVRILTTLLPADSGTGVVDGVDVRAEPDEARRRIGVSGQYAAVDEYLTGYENLEMVGRLYHLGRSKARRRAKELLEQFGLADAANRVAKTYSGGMRRRLDLAGALVAEPRVLFLDEPTTGLDPRSRMALWDVIGELVRGGTTLLLTTQYLDEAERLADNIMVVDKGTSIAEGNADALKSKVGGERLEIIATDEADVATITATIAAVGSGEPAIDGRKICLPVATGPKALMEALRLLSEREIELHDVSLRRPTLDDVFLALTGHVAENIDNLDPAAMEAIA
jgi:ABC-2 type transport system ATP-binding protein